MTCSLIIVEELTVLTLTSLRIVFTCIVVILILSCMCHLL